MSSSASVLLDNHGCPTGHFDILEPCNRWINEIYAVHKTLIDDFAALNIRLIFGQPNIRKF